MLKLKLVCSSSHRPKAWVYSFKAPEDIMFKRFQAIFENLPPCTLKKYAATLSARMQVCHSRVSIAECLSLKPLRNLSSTKEKQRTLRPSKRHRGANQRQRNINFDDFGDGFPSFIGLLHHPVSMRRKMFFKM